MASHNELSEGSRTKTLFYEEDILKNLQHLKRFIRKVKPQDHYARGWEDSRVILLDTVEVIEKILIKAFTLIGRRG